MSLGNEWKSVLRAKEPSEEDQARKGEERQKEILASLPNKVREAIKNGADRVTLYGWVTQQEVLGDVDAFWKRVGSSRPLKPTDVSGIARAVVVWCDENGLECRMESVRVPMNDNEYNLEARPR